MVAYYHQHAEEYFQRTVAIDPSSFLTDFVRLLPPRATILDLGCGSGRDLRWLRQQGFAGTGLEQSPALARLAAEHSGCPVITGDFETFDFSQSSFDALLASGSLVHTPHQRLPGIISRAARTLPPAGIFYISLKQGRGHRTDALGRPFYYWQDPDLRALFARIGLNILNFATSNSALNSSDQWLAYVLHRSV
ncbi:MAG: class I SAM-dependent methyltransferase [Desulfosalsimonas sp.]